MSKKDTKVLRSSKRKGPKKAYRAKIPTAFYLKPRAYDQLRKLVEWVDAIPEGIELTEGTWDLIHERFERALRKCLPTGLYVASIQIETEATRAETPYTRVGDLVALVEDDEMIDAGSTEIHVPVYRRVG